VSAAAAILAGGRARRLGGAVKPLLDVGGRRIVDRVREALSPLVEEIVVVGDAALLGDVGARVVGDLRPGLGPLAGLEAALASTAGDPLLLVGGDMPFVTTSLLSRLLSESPSAEAVCFHGPRGDEPLCARYARRLLPAVRARLDAGRLALHHLLDEAAAIRIEPRDEEERAALDNVNSPAELLAARLRASLIRDGGAPSG
jgi:molybdopterin-guanine dinucleotide biosynthesis protein A